MIPAVARHLVCAVTLGHDQPTIDTHVAVLFVIKSVTLPLFVLGVPQHLSLGAEVGGFMNGTLLVLHQTQSKPLTEEKMYCRTYMQGLLCLGNGCLGIGWWSCVLLLGERRWHCWAMQFCCLWRYKLKRFSVSALTRMAFLRPLTFCSKLPQIHAEGNWFEPPICAFMAAPPAVQVPFPFCFAVLAAGTIAAYITTSLSIHIKHKYKWWFGST
jgi:hypothetical protein